jgi:hypothetical protein
MKKKTKITWSIVGILIIAIIIAGGVLGVIPGVSDVFGTNKPRDLGVKYTKQDYDSGMKKLGFAIDRSAGSGPDTQLVYSTKTKKVDAELTNAEISALLSYDHADKYPVRNAQVKINADGTVELSAAVALKDYKGISFNNAAYFKGRITKESSKSLNLQADAIEAGRLELPQKEKVVREVEREVNSRLERIPGLSIDSLEVKDEGKVHLQGTIPESANRTKKYYIK